MGLAGVILAAGESTRMGQDKALLPWPPRSAAGRVRASAPTRGDLHSGTLLSSAIEVLSDICDLVIVVAGTNEADLKPVIYGCGAFLARNPAPELGQFSSLQTGLREVLNHGRDSAVVTLVDRPAPARDTLQSLATAFINRSYDVWAVVPEYQGKHGHPIVIGRELIEEFLKAPITANARDIEHAHQQRIQYLPVEDSRVTMNINTPEDYASLESAPGVRH